MTTATLPELGTLDLQESEHKRSWNNGRRFSEDPMGPSIVYVFVDGETIEEQLITRRMRPYNLIRKPLEAMLRERGIKFEKLQWSQKAGCDCPCSPGFIIRGGDRGKNYWLTIRD